MSQVIIASAVFIAKGFTPDARPSTMAATGTQLRPGRLSQTETRTAMVELLDDVGKVALAVPALETVEPHGLDPTIEILATIGRYTAIFDLASTSESTAGPRALQRRHRTDFRGQTPEWSPMASVSQ